MMETAVQREGSASKKMPKTYKSYLLNKCAIGYGLINGVVNAGVFYAMHLGEFDATFGYAAILTDVAITGFLLGIILMACVLPLTRVDMRKDVFEVPAQPKGLGSHLPKSIVGSALLIGLATTIVVVAVAAVIALVLPLPLTCMQMMVFKGCMCVVAGATAGYLTIGKVAHDQISVR